MLWSIDCNFWILRTPLPWCSLRSLWRERVYGNPFSYITRLSHVTYVTVNKYWVILNGHIRCRGQFCLHPLPKGHRKMIQEEIERDYSNINEFTLLASCVRLACFNFYGLLIRCLRVSTVKVSKRKWETGSFYHLGVLFNGLLFS